ncbi:hypothetical protein GGI03_005152 [Coemansia sp. RSA 2337]|nr:hypothetical protein H4S03_002401 [Coemansia sp. S3946]KAJ2046065.1 hypothetical protein H4S04_005263 [Coemansia sp. S16]KAJ2073381.1 hypothetical protein GGH13_002036 [Coemansia sp. S155-1]KAJ2460973.1 hypothetical protein GGI03_005152 [Coemansia sp. RSA 2337]
MKITIGAVCVFLVQGALANKCPQPPSPPPYSVVPSVAPTSVSSSSLPYVTSSAPTLVTSTEQYLSSPPGYTSVKDPYSTRPMPSDFGSSSETVPTVPPTFYTSVKDPFSTLPMSSDFTYSSTAPTPTPAPPIKGLKLTQKQLNLAIPVRAASDSCASVGTPAECVTNDKALAAINSALVKYGITKRGEAVAVIALMAYESGNWQYNTNHFPGRPGQGTRAMLMFNFVESYAKALHPEEAAKALAGGITDESMNSVRALVLNDNDSFGSGFWYLVTNAAAYHNTGKLRDGNLEDFKDYVLTGVGAGWDSDRQTIWETVNSAINA